MLPLDCAAGRTGLGAETTPSAVTVADLGAPSAVGRTSVGPGESHGRETGRDAATRRSAPASPTGDPGSFEVAP